LIFLAGSRWTQCGSEKLATWALGNGAAVLLSQGRRWYLGKDERYLSEDSVDPAARLQISHCSLTRAARQLCKVITDQIFDAAWYLGYIPLYFPYDIKERQGPIYWKIPPRGGGNISQCHSGEKI
jgi:hypothetical protein